MYSPVMPSNIVVIDLETKGLARGVEILGIAWANSDEAGAEKYNEANRAHWQSIFDTETLVFHNAKFDVRVLRDCGYTIRPGSYYDTQVMAYVIDSSHESFSLKNCALREGTATKIDFTPDGGWDTAEWSPEMEDYAAADAEATHQLYQKYRHQISADAKALHHFNRVEMPFVEVILEMESTGFTLDMGALRALHHDLSAQTGTLLSGTLAIGGMVAGGTVEYKARVPLGVGDAMTGATVTSAVPYCLVTQSDLARPVTGKRTNFEKGELALPRKFELVERNCTFDHCTVEPFNPNSGRHIAATLTKLHGWEPVGFTPTGQPKTDAESLGYVSDTMPLAALLVEYAEVNKVLTSFIGPFLEMQDAGVLRANFNQTVTVTGRLSSSNPNLQNVPTRSELGQRVRALVVAPPAHSVVGIDLANIEARVLASYLALKCGDFAMATAFNAGLDLHQANAEAWGMSRPDAKTTLFGALYGAGPLKLGGGDKAKGTAMLKTLRDNAPAMFELKELAWKAAQNGNGLVHTLFGRRLNYADIIPTHAVRSAKALKASNPEKYTESTDRLAQGLSARAKRQVFNALLQGTAADIMKLLTIEAMPLIRQAQGFLSASVHDEIIVYCPTPYATWLAGELTKLFHRDDLLPHVWVDGEAKVGASWQEIH